MPLRHPMTAFCLVCVLFCASGLACGLPAASGRPLPFPVPASGAYIGAFVGSARPSLAAFNTDAEKPHAFFMRFVEVGGPDFDEGISSSAQFARECADEGAMPYFTIEPIHATPTALLTPADVEWVEHFAHELGALHRPAFLRFGHEMNGNWYAWGWGRTPPAVYIAGFRQVAEIFRREAPYVAMVWAPSQNWGRSTDDVYSHWYPGDDYVDWAGLTTYQWPYSGLSSSQFLDSIEHGDGPEGDFYTTFAVGHSKPMLIAETACGDDSAAYYDNWCYSTNMDEAGTYGTSQGLGAQRWWIDQVYSAGGGPRTLSGWFPRIKAVSWFSAEDTEEGADFQIGGSDPTSHSVGFEAYASAVSNPYWVSAVPDPAVVTTVTADADLAAWSNHDLRLTLEPTSTYSAPPIQTWFRLGEGELTAYVSPIMVSAEGVTPVEFFSQDAAGVREDTRTVVVRIDKTAPRIIDDHVDTYDGAAAIKLSASDALSGVSETEWRIDGGPWTAGSTVSVAASGRHVVDCRATDNAGNMGQAETVAFEVRSLAVVQLTSTSATSLVYGTKFAIRGTLTGDGVGLAGRTVILQTAEPGAQFKDSALAVTTNATGAFSLSFSPRTKTYFRVRFAGSVGYTPAVSAESVYAKPKAYLRAPSARKSIPRPRILRVEGDLFPRHRPRTHPVRIYLWRKTARGEWRGYGYVKAVAADCSTHTKYSSSVRFPSSGSWRMRAYAPADGGHASAWSGTSVYVTVR